MRITWVTRSFLDYRLPVFAALDELCGHQLTVIYNAEVVPERCGNSLKVILGERAIAMTGEKRLTGQSVAPVSTTRRQGVRIPLQPGLIKACKDSRPDVVISDGFFQWTYAALWMRLFHGVRHVMCYEPTKHTERNVQWYRTLYRRLASRLIDAICCNGSLCLEYCRDVLHVSEGKLSVGQMAADTKNLAEACANVPQGAVESLKLRLDLSGRVFLYVGRLVEVKGLNELLKAWRDAALTDATLLLVGDGPLRQSLEEFCRADKLDNVVFAGNVDYGGIAEYYRASDIFIIPTLQDNWSLVVPEAMACGLPVASSIYNGCWPELVTPENGWTFDPLKPDDFVDVLKKIHVMDKLRLHEMGERSRGIVVDYSPDSAAKAIFAATVVERKDNGK